MNVNGFGGANRESMRVERVQAQMKIFDVPLGCDVDPARLRWPGADEVRFDATPAGNQHYEDLRGLTWTDLATLLPIEARLIAQIEAAGDPAAEEMRISETLAEDAAIDAVHPLRGLDIGVAAAVFALSALGAIPAASCNGSAFGAFHQGYNPYVAFFIRPRRLRLLEPWARAAGLGLTMTEDGIAVLQARRVWDLHAFATIALEGQGATR